MTEKELRRLGRAELVEMLLDVTLENQSLREQIEETKKQTEEEISQLKSRLEDRTISIEKAGSIAEAALEINGVFAAAQAAAQQYLDNLKSLDQKQGILAQRMQAEAEKKAEAIVAEANSYSRNIHAKADEYSEKTCSAADEYARKVRSEADTYSKKAYLDADAYWQKVNSKVQEVLQEQESLRALLLSGERK